VASRPHGGTPCLRVDELHFRARPLRPFGVTDVYLPQQVAADFGTWLGLRAHFELEEMDGLSHDALQELGARDGVEVAWDTLVVEL
jgi:hypothetical protein